MSSLAENIKDFSAKYDFAGQSYSSMYPNLHKYPATMLPQIGVELLKDFNAKKTNLLDPYCGSGSSFISGVEYGIKVFVGFDLNPLAVMIAKARLEFIETNELLEQKNRLLYKLNDRANLATQNPKITLDFSPLSRITNLDFWIEKDAQKDLLHIFWLVKNIAYKPIQNLFLLAFSETLRESSFVRNNEFKLFRMKNFEAYKPRVYEIFTRKLEAITQNYLGFYQPKLRGISFDICASPPYGDSKTTVAYGQFATFINEWLGFTQARKLDTQLLGGKKATKLYEKTCIKEHIAEIAKIDKKRALEISSFYSDLESSIISLVDCVHIGGKAFFVIGNRTVKNITLPTDKFIAEIFCANGFKHISTLKRKISNKAMPRKNSPTNKKGILAHTMNDEHIIVCEKIN